MSDLIRREDALDAITNIDTSIIPFPKAREYVEIGFEIVINRLKKLPSAEPERKKGKWMLYYNIEQGRALRCSECKMVFWVGDGREGNFCPNCGAKMDEK